MDVSEEEMRWLEGKLTAKRSVDIKEDVDTRPKDTPDITKKEKEKECCSRKELWSSR